MQVITTTETVSKPEQVFWRYLMSDLHLGSPSVDLKRLKRDLDAAAARGAKILINGDVFDAIDNKDKRSTPSVLVPELQGKVDLINAVVSYAADILTPYARHIEIIGIGNHEFKWIKWNSVDPVTLLIEKLNARLAESGSSHRISHGGNNGYWRSSFVCEGGGVCRHDLYYFHGSGGDSPVSKGTIDAYRKSVQFEYDCVTFGHKHNKLFVDDAVMYLSPNGHVRTRERKAIQTGSYYRNYACGSPLSVSYAEEFHHAPKPLGGVFLGLMPRRDRPGGNSLRRVDQVIVSDPLPIGA